MTREALASILLAALAAGGCVVWPAGTGPHAAPMPVAEALARRDRGELVLIDVRSSADYEQGHIPGALSIPASQIEARIGEIRRLGKQPVLYCG